MKILSLFVYLQLSSHQPTIMEYVTPNYLRPIDLEMKSELEIAEYLQMFGLIPRTVDCPRCGEPKTLKLRQKKYAEFNCRKKNCEWRVSARTVGSPLLKDTTSSNLSLKKILEVIMEFTVDEDVEKSAWRCKLSRHVVG